MMEKLKPHWKKFLFIASSSIVIIAIYGLVHLPESDMASIQTPEPTPPDPTGPTPTSSGVMPPEPVKNPPGFGRRVLMTGIADYFVGWGYTDLFEGDNFSCWERPVMLYQLLGGNEMRIHYDEDNFNETRVWVSVSLNSFDAQKRNFTGRVAIDPCGSVRWVLQSLRLMSDIIKR